MKKLEDALKRKAGKGTKPALSCDANIDEDNLYDHINDIAKNPKRPPYSWHPWSPNHCRTFANDAFGAGR